MHVTKDDTANLLQVLHKCNPNEEKCPEPEDGSVTDAEEEIQADVSSPGTWNTGCEEFGKRVRHPHQLWRCDLTHPVVQHHRTNISI